MLRTRAIVVDDRPSINGQVRTLVHELAHALVRAEAAEDDAHLSHAEEELLAEAVAYTVCGTLGFDTSGETIPYPASWSQETPIETIQQTAERIHRIATRIEDAIPDRPAHDYDLGGHPRQRG